MDATRLKYADGGDQSRQLDHTVDENSSDLVEPGGSAKQSMNTTLDCRNSTKRLTTDELETVGCNIVDFGNACWTHKRFTSDIQTRQYRCPEVRLDV